MERNANPAPRERSFNASTRQVGIVVLFISIAVLFIATLVAVLITRAHAKFLPSHPGTVHPTLIVASIGLALTSFALQRALDSVRHNRQRALQKWLWTGGAFAAFFLIAQAFNWSRLWNSETAFNDLYAFTFCLLTGVHALHVLGGFVPLGIVIHRAGQREYSSSRYEGVLFCVQYWHFLGVIWLLLWAALIVLG
jgi:cytochrome c oxidase subunit 3